MPEAGRAMPRKPATVVREVRADGIAAPPDATWSDCLLVGREVVMSGVTARRVDGKPVGGDSLKGQTRACFERIATLLEGAGGSLANVYKLVIYVADITRKDEINAARAKMFAPLFPCSTLIEVKGFAFPDLIVEIDAFANLDIDLQASVSRHGH